MAALLAACGSTFAAEPPAGKSADESADRGAELLNRLRRRDPDAALQKYSGRWRKADRSEPTRSPSIVPESLSHAPTRLSDATPAAPVLRRQETDAPAAEIDGERPDLGVDLDDLGLDDLNLPDDLRLDPNAPGRPFNRLDDAADRTPRPSELDRPIREVRDLKSIGEILPFGDYDPYPDPDDPCRNLCPRPAGCPPGDGSEVALCPEVTPLSTDTYAPRPVLPVQYRWAASNITYNPLYFQDVSLERYGHNHGLLQPVVSVARFGTQVVGLPYQMALDPPCKCETPLGYYRPGDCAPKLHYQIPLNARAALVQAAAVSGVALILP